MSGAPESTRYLGRVNRFFDDLGARFAGAASRRGVEIEAPGLEPVVADELLDLARVAAHTAERRFAPLATLLAGAAVARPRQAGGRAAPPAGAGLRTDGRGGAGGARPGRGAPPDP